ncbi:hypothetical protein CM15mP43_08390 [bacterium]|nr:MAG: hypothetical protein CM15mP43_08390 [bacterium]
MVHNFRSFPSLKYLDGLLLYSFGVLLPSIEIKYGLSNTIVASIFSLRCLVFAFSMIIFGKLTDKYKPEKIIFLVVLYRD